MQIKVIAYLPTASFIFGGGEIAPLCQYKHMAINNFELSLITAKTDQETEYYTKFKEENPKIKFIELNSPEFGTDFSKFNSAHENVHKLYFSYKNQINEILSNERYDLFISNYAPGINCTDVAIKKCLFLRGTPSDYSEVNDLAVKNSDIVIADSHSIKREWKEKLIKMSPDKEIHVLNNGMDILDLKEETRIDNQIFYLGRLIPIKGVEVLIRAISKVVNDFPKIKLIIGGKGNEEYTSLLHNLVSELKLNENVEFKGLLTEEEKYLYLRNSSFAVFPSYAKEGVLTTMLEAASQKCPIITTNSCGMPDFVISEEIGLLANPNDADSLSEKIRLFLEDKDLRNNCSEKAFIRVKNEFSWQKNIEKLQEIFSHYEIK